MRVVIISRGAFPGYDGPARRVKYLGAGLARNGCDVSLLVSYPPNPVSCDDAFEARYGFRYRHTRRRAQSASSGLATKVWNKLAGTAAAYGAVGAEHRKARVDALLICGVGFVELLVAWIVAKRFGLKIGADKNDINYRLKSRIGVTFYGTLSGINIALSDFLLTHGVDTVFTVNRRLHDEYSGRAARVRFIIPSFIDEREIAAVQPMDDLFDRYQGLRLLSVVTTPPHSYGFIPFAEALARLRDRYDYRLYLLCSPDRETRACVDQLLSAHGLADRTRILTEISPEIVQSVYAGADIILNAQQEPALAEGGFPGKTAEILASGRPIITTLFSDLDKYYVDGVNSLVVTYGDIDGYRQAIGRLCDSPDLRRQLGAEARRTALDAFEYVRGTRPLKADLEEMVRG